jgi:hypothetical protein
MMIKPAQKSKPVTYTIKTAAARMNLTEAYVRSLIRTGKLVSNLEPIGFEAAVKRHIITETDITDFLRDTPRKTKRTDGRNKYVFYATPEEVDQTLTALRGARLDIIAGFIHTANRLKSRPMEDEDE